ncbi:site-specific DNA-methyltransferase [Nereida sp. MMG025]|uniref:site-specific DNA-methyltransferase n=1 Tax=Nereida sp. MMG025 TaxID=2909981 RepID=UPI001F4144AC|nr:site-specific DNA-methyltransferase [Nereida sp. MMG025]MCF6443155.1 site-specific DNA-methyltransferase [Nereida sp. MMG025]
MPTLDWLGREAHLRAAEAVPYRLLTEDDTLGVAAQDGADNLLVQGDNLEALKALLPFYAGKVKCIYIDPPYNTRSAFEHYDDSLEHAQWLGMIVPRLMLLREFLSEDGSIWVSIDDNEGHYLKVVMDEIFGRRNFVASVIWEKRKSRENRRVFSFKHDFILSYANDKVKFASSRNPIPISDDVRKRYRNPDDDPRGNWQSVAITAQAGHGTASQFYDVTTPNGRKISPPSGNCWRYNREKLGELIDEGRIYFGKTGGNVPRLKKFLSESSLAGMTPETLWYADDVGTNDEAKRSANQLFGSAVFDTPKPERLLQRILHIATNPGDLVLDSFLGSGTTAAVAHKMGRRWIGVEMGDHARTHCATRLHKVIEGEQGGISKDVDWQGGGGFRFCTLGPAVFDAEGRVADGIRFPDLARHVWFAETKTPLTTAPTASPVLGTHGDRTIALLFNGILKDRSAQGGNVLTHATLQLIREDAGHDGPLTVYGAACRLSEATLRDRNIVFRQTPYDLPQRA